MDSTRIGLASVLSLALTLLVLTGCPRQDPSAVTPAQLQDLYDQIEDQNRELAAMRTQPAPAAAGGAATNAASVEQFSRVLDQINSLREDITENRRGLTATINADDLDNALDRLKRDIATLQQQRKEDLQTAEKQKEMIETALDGYQTRIEAQATRISELENNMTAELRKLVESLSHLTGPGSNQAMSDELKALRARLDSLEGGGARIDNEALNALREKEKELRDRVKELVVENQKLKDRIAELEGMPDPTPESQPDDPPPASASGGAYTGSVYVVKSSSEDPMELSAIVRFAPQTPYNLNARYNVFDRKGKKIGDFVVTSNSTPAELVGKTQWFGGYIRLLNINQRPVENDRVSNLTRVPDLDDGSGNSSGEGDSSDLPGGNPPGNRND